MDLNQHKAVLYSTKQILKHQEEKEKLKGEKFNIFSVLKMETKENATHSAFLAALLNPLGTHMKGSVFLELFLNCVNNQTIDLASARVKMEHSIGKNDINNKTGGRIDIYIWDKNGNCLCIENKIHAGDQIAQIERYCNHNKDKNQVFYLTLNGGEPSTESKGDLISGTHFFNISYGSHIVDWLTLCMKEAADTPMLRETIKQYILLMKKLTYTMDKKEEHDLLEVILNNYDASMFLANNITKTVANFNNKIRQSVFESLKETLGEKYMFDYGDSTLAPCSQIWIRVRAYETEKLYFGIQNFSITTDPFFGAGIIIGIFMVNADYKEEYKTLGAKSSDYWCAVKNCSSYKNFEIDLQNSVFLNKLITSVDFYNGFIEHIVAETITYINENVEDVIRFLKKV
jgi:hypothetical protein